MVVSLAWCCVYGFGQRIVNFGQSMQPMIRSGETVLLNKVIYRFKRPSRFDVIYFSTIDGRDNIKRIIGLPGESVQIKDSIVYVNDIAMEGEYGQADIAGLASQVTFLGKDEYFVLGDNRDSSEDSRFESIGNVHLKDIQGVVWFRVSSLFRLGFIR